MGSYFVSFYKDCRVYSNDMFARVQQLFEGYDDLYERFRQFLPDNAEYNYEMAQRIGMNGGADVNPYGSPVQYGTISKTYVCSETSYGQQFATQYIATIQERFNNEGDNTYDQFMALLAEYQRGLRAIPDIVLAVCISS